MIESIRKKSSRGGSTNLKKSRNVKERKSYSEKKESAYYRVCERFGDTMVKELSNTWNVLQTGFGESDHGEGDGIIMSMINMKMSEVEIMSVIDVGSLLVLTQRVEKVLQLNQKERFKDLSYSSANVKAAKIIS